MDSGSFVSRCIGVALFYNYFEMRSRQMARRTSRIHRGRQPAVSSGTIGRPVIHRARAHLLPKGTVSPPRISQFVTCTSNQPDSAGNILWTFVNADQNNSHAVVLYRNNYIFGGAFWPIYLGPDDSVSHMLDGTQPIPTLTGTGGTVGGQGCLVLKCSAAVGG
jgi:hypothetical protein